MRYKLFSYGSGTDVVNMWCLNRVMGKSLTLMIVWLCNEAHSMEATLTWVGPLSFLMVVVRLKSLKGVSTW